VSHPLRRLWQDQDGGETTVLTRDSSPGRSTDLLTRDWAGTVAAADGRRLLPTTHHDHSTTHHDLQTTHHDHSTTHHDQPINVLVVRYTAS